MSLLGVPRHSLDRLRKKGGDRQSWIAPRRSRRLSPGLVAVFVPRGDSSVSLVTLVKNLHVAQIHFVRLQNRVQPARYQPHRFPQPQEIVLCRDRRPASQHPEESSLQRRKCHESPIQIKKRRNSSALLLYFL